jgi:hypothetical protein
VRGDWRTCIDARVPVLDAQRQAPAASIDTDSAPTKQVRPGFAESNPGAGGNEHRNPFAADRCDVRCADRQRELQRQPSCVAFAQADSGALPLPRHEQHSLP